MKRIIITAFFITMISFGFAGKAKVAKYSTDSYTFYQHKGVRVYFSEEFLVGFVKISNVAQYKTEFFSTIGNLLDKGSLTGEMFLKELRDASHSVINLHKDDLARFNKQDSVYESMKKFKGRIIKILYCKLKNREKSGKKIEYEVWVTPFWSETGWGSFHIFKVVFEKKANGSCKLIEFQYKGEQL